jgi:hypothetical protein
MTNASGIANLHLETVSGMESGIYFVTVKTNGRPLTQKIVLTK